MTKLLFFGEPLIRITPTDCRKIENQVKCEVFYGGSEINIARTLSGMNLSTRLITALPQNAMGDSFIHYLNSSGIETDCICRKGERIGLYYSENGFGVRSSQVYYDRANTSIGEIDLSQIEMDALFKDISHFHFSGITVAISPHVRDILHLLLEEAKNRQITISTDLNLRTKMISVNDAKKEFSIYAKYADICFGIDPIMINETDIKMFNREEATVEEIESRMRDLQHVYGFKAIFHTQRSVDSHQINHYKAYGLIDSFETSIEMTTPILERIGSGDAFVSGALYQLIHQAPLKEVLNFAVASGTLKCTIQGDSMFEPASTIYQLINSSKEIIR